MGLLQNSPNEKNEIDFPERGCLSHFLLEAEVVKKQIQQKQYSRQNKLPNKKPPHYDAKQDRNAGAAVLSE